MTRDDTADHEPAGEETADVEGADVEEAAGFLDDRDSDREPQVLRFTADPESDHRERTLERIERWEAGEEVPRVVNFENPADLRALLTDRRIELLRSVMTDRPESIRGLADRVDRDVKSVHSDLQVLAEYDVVRFESAGRAKRPYVPYETIEVALEISGADGTNAAPA
jgi:predicted transcriptional regulator